LGVVGNALIYGLEATVLNKAPNELKVTYIVNPVSDEDTPSVQPLIK
jgi:hypothetical protein